MYVGFARSDRLGEDGTSTVVDVESGKPVTRDIDIVGKGVTVSLHMTSPGNVVEFGYAAIASLPPGEQAPAMPHTITEGRACLIQMSQGGGTSTVREGFVVKDRKIDFEHAAPGRNIACISPFDGDPNDPTVLARLEHDVVDWPIYCQWFDIPASPDRTDITIEVQPLEPTP